MRGVLWIGQLVRPAIAAAVIAGSASAPRTSESSLVAGADIEVSDGIIAPGGSPDPLRCVDRLAIGPIGQALETVWSPDSARIAFTRIVTSRSSRTVTGFEEDPGVGILEVASGAIRQLGPGSRPQWAPTGHYLSFWRAGRLYVVFAGRVLTSVEPTMPEVRWVGDELVYFQNDEIRAWGADGDVPIATVDLQYMPRYPQDWVDWSADGLLFTLTRYHMDGQAERYVGQTRTGQFAPLQTSGTTYTEWAPAGQTLLVRSSDQVELRGGDGSDAIAPTSAFPGRVHGWAPDGKQLLMGKLSPTVPAGPRFDRFAVWDGNEVTATATLPNLLGSRAFSPDGRYFAGVARNGLYETALEVYRCGSRASPVPSRADPISRSFQQRIEDDPRHFVRPVIGYFSQFVQGAHTGIDVAAPFGSIITAADDGEVTFVGWRPVGGRAVCVQHPSGIESCDYHTSQALVTVGQHVARGEPVALIGMTGATTGPHTHWEAKRGGQIVDPFQQ